MGHGHGFSSQSLPVTHSRSSDLLFLAVAESQVVAWCCSVTRRVGLLILPQDPHQSIVSSSQTLSLSRSYHKKKPRDFELVLAGAPEYNLTREDVGCLIAFVYIPINFEGKEGESASVVSDVARKGTLSYSRQCILMINSARFLASVWSFKEIRLDFIGR
ncbi:hypothetical protein Droror1_Dr00021340 [Drosera rotundifolia]